MLDQTNLSVMLKNKNLLKNKAYINGAWVDAKSGKTFEVVQSDCRFQNLIKYLYGLKKVENFNHCSSDLSITEAWIKRWVIKRILRKESLEKIGKSNYKTLSSLFENVVKEYANEEENFNLFSNMSN